MQIVFSVHIYIYIRAPTRPSESALVKIADCMLSANARHFVCKSTQVFNDNEKTAIMQSSVYACNMI